MVHDEIHFAREEFRIMPAVEHNLARAFAGIPDDPPHRLLHVEVVLDHGVHLEPWRIEVHRQLDVVAVRSELDFDIGHEWRPAGHQ